MVHEVNDRVQINGNFCTIRFIGEIHRWPRSITYGVEWDDPRRGKNSGTIDNREYFKTVVPNSGSFLKDSKWSVLLNTEVSFYEALQEKYGKSHDKNKEIYLGSKKVESFGFEKLTIEERGLRQLKRICLDHSRIASFKKNSPVALEDYSGILELDISYNLLANIEETFEFITRFQNLKSLDLSGNYFTKGWATLTLRSFRSVKVLCLSNCQLELHQLRHLMRFFPSVEILNVSRNFLGKIDHEEMILPNSIKELILSDNSIRNFPIGLSQWSSLQTLDLSHNKIVTVCNLPAIGLKNLDLSFNLVSNWQVLDQINVDFPELHSFRVNGNPLFDNATDVLAQFYVVIARFNCLHILNGSILSKKDLEEAKLFFVSLVSQGLIEYDKSSEIWRHLSSKYAARCKSERNSESWLGSQILSLQVRQEETEHTIDLTVLSSYTVRNLKRIICEHLCMHISEISIFYLVSPSVFEEVNQDFIPVSDLNVTNGDFLHVKRKRHH